MSVGASRKGDAHMSPSATPEPVIRQIVEAMRTLAGPHPGFRPVHAKGLVCSGTFRASADAPRIARTPEEFLEFLRAQLPEPASGKPDPDAVPRFLAGHPAGRAFVERLMKKPVPASYAQAIYHAEHAFRFTAADGTSRFGRYRFVPEAGEALLSPDDGGKRSANFLSNELDGRL